MNCRAIPGAYLFRLYVCDKEISWTHHIGETHQPDWVVYVRDSEKFRLTNVIPEWIIFVSRGITVYGYVSIPVLYFSTQSSRECHLSHHFLYRQSDIPSTGDKRSAILQAPSGPRRFFFFWSNNWRESQQYGGWGTRSECQQVSSRAMCGLASSCSSCTRSKRPPTSNFFFKVFWRCLIGNFSTAAPRGVKSARVAFEHPKRLSPSRLPRPQMFTVQTMWNAFIPGTVSSSQDLLSLVTISGGKRRKKATAFSFVTLGVGQWGGHSVKLLARS